MLEVALELPRGLRMNIANPPGCSDLGRPVLAQDRERRIRRHVSGAVQSLRIRVAAATLAADRATARRHGRRRQHLYPQQDDAKGDSCTARLQSARSGPLFQFARE